MGNSTLAFDCTGRGGDACDQTMAVAKADASSSVRPRSLDMIANQAASAEPVHDDITGSCIKSFEHRHRRWDEELRARGSASE